ncbi:MAG: PQQ-like beta-propeller repeat protein, partial [Bacteroidia bacterium]|nr:PQQ-like beta-propeller repeat protein [Bacteroidia bacterium]
STLIITSLMPGVNGFSQSTDIPGWRGANRDGKITGFKAPATWPKELTKVWEVTVGLGDASPVLVKGKFYLLVDQDSTEILLCLDAKSGKQVWKTAINKAPKVTGGAASHPGPRSTPYVSGGKVFSLGAGGVVACHDAKKGKLIWKNESYTTEVPQFFTSASPLLTDKLCILPLGGKENGVVVAFDINSGLDVWKVSGIPCTYSSPVFMAIGETIIVDQSETALVGITMDGQLIGEIPTPGQQRFYNSSTPVIDGQDIIVAGAGTGTIKYHVTNEAGYNYSEVWTNPKLGVSFNTPVLKDGFLYANDSKSGYLYCLNAETGETAWADTVKLNRFASMLDLGPAMLSLAGNATMVIFEPNGSAFKQLAKYKVSETEIYAHPLAVDNKIYVKDKEKLTCWEVN